MAHSACIDAVIFDWGGTLTPWHTVDILAGWRDVARVLDPHRVEEAAARLLAAEEALWHRARIRHASATLDEVFALAELTVAENALVQDALTTLFTFWEPHTYLDPEVPALFRALRERGVKVGVLSNTMWPRAEHERMFERDGVLGLIDGAVYSSEIAWAKPHPEAFAAALKAVDVGDPARAVYVGDRLFEDVYGAQAAGLRAVYVPHSEIPGYQQGHTQGVPDAVVQRLAELLPVVDSWR
ncbi:MAG TPA: HAD family hydrolase [Mycobacteriales bacterium]|nr:HAD family hydrolase [Mycobacteriales bacterium]